MALIWTGITGNVEKSSGNNKTQTDNVTGYKNTLYVSGPAAGSWSALVRLYNSSDVQVATCGVGSSTPEPPPVEFINDDTIYTYSLELQIGTIPTTPDSSGVVITLIGGAKDRNPATTPVIPIATASILGGVKSGTNLAVDATTGVASVDNPTFASITNSAIPAGRVVYTGTAGIEKSNPALIFDDTANQEALKLTGTAGAYLLISGAFGSVRDLQYRTGGVLRMALRLTPADDFAMIFYNDAGTSIDQITFTRAANGSITIPRPVTFSSAIAAFHYNGSSISKAIDSTLLSSDPVITFVTVTGKTITLPATDTTGKMRKICYAVNAGSATVATTNRYGGSAVTLNPGQIAEFVFDGTKWCG